jgi:hypothetical protein
MHAARDVTTENWGIAPFNRWSFQHVQELFPTCRLARGPGSPLSLPHAERSVLQLAYDAPDGARTSVAAMLERACCDAFLAVQGGCMVAEHYFNGAGPHAPHLLNSVTKSFVGMLAGIGVERGQLETSAPITRYLPEMVSAAWRGTTVRHLLDMTAAARYSEDYSDPQTDFWQESAVVGWRPALVDDRTPPSLLDYARSLDGQDMQNGSRFRYRTVCTNVLGMVLERAMGERLATLLETEIWSHLATEHDASIVVDRSHFPFVGAGMSATARDLLNFGLMMINDGSLGGRQIVPAAWIADTVAGDSTSRDCFAKGEYGQVMPGWHYRNQVWIASSEPAVMLAIGIHGQLVYMDKARDLVIVMLSSQPEPLDLGLSLQVLVALMAIASGLAGCRHLLPVPC